MAFRLISHSLRVCCAGPKNEHSKARLTGPTETYASGTSQEAPRGPATPLGEVNWTGTSGEHGRG